MSLKIRNITISVLAAAALAAAAAPSAHAQFIDATQGLMLSPSAEMNPEGTFMITNNFVNQEYLPSSGWDYNTFTYGFSITFWKRLEVAYTMTIFNDHWSPNPITPTTRGLWMVNQDRHFAARFQLLKEGELWSWTPSIVAGISDPVTGGANDYLDDNVGETGNGYFNRMYLAATKHISTGWGRVGVTAAYLYTRRSDFLKSNRPTAGLTWEPVWPNRGDSFLTSFRLIAEYDTRNVNLGLTASVFRDHFEAMVCLEGCKYINAGLRYKLVLKQ